MSGAHAVPVLGFTAWSGSGKTTLIARLLPILKARGLRVGVVKHAHHDFDIDYPGKDSHTLRQAGASQVLVGSRRRWALIVDSDSDREPPLWELMNHLLPHQLDIILVEGFKLDTIPKIEVHRPSLMKPLMCVSDASIVALATDAEPDASVHVPRLDLNDPEAIAVFVVTRFLGPRPGGRHDGSSAA